MSPLFIYTSNYVLIISDPTKEEGEKMGRISKGGLGTHVGLGYWFGYYLDVIGFDVLMNLELSLSLS